MKKATTMAFPVMITSIGLGGPYAIHAAFALVSTVFIANFTCETKGLELGDMKG